MFFEEKTLYLLKVFFYNKIWLKFYNLNFNSRGVYINTFTSSLNYWRLNPSLKQIKYNNIVKKPLKYLKPIPTLYFSFNKLRYNTFIVLLLKLCVDYYYTVSRSFFLSYSFLFHINNYYLYNFSNKYYFQIRHY